MKINKFVLWILGSLSLVGCKQLTCDFTCTPAVPRAGEPVTFSNKSTGADDFFWTFGDNATSETNSPTHIFKKPGTYTVTLQVMRNKVEKRVCTHQITVGDTIPAIAVSSDSVCTYVPVTLQADVYNPWKHATAYEWSLPSSAVVLQGADMNSASMLVYFPHAGAQTVQLTLQLGEKTFNLQKVIEVTPSQGPSVLMTRAEQPYEQHFFTVLGQRVYAEVEPTALDTNITLLKQEQDTVFVYGDSTFTVKKVGQRMGKTLVGFQPDRLMGKLYGYNHEGLWVSAITGQYLRQLVTNPVQAIKVDVAGNRLYWATPEGVFCARLLQTRDNQEAFVPDTVNTCSDVTCLSVNLSKH